MTYASPVLTDVRPQGNGMAFVSLLMGLLGLIMSVVVGWIPIVGFFLILLPTLLGIIFGYVARSQAAQGAGHGGKAAAGLICGFVGLILTGLMQLLWAAVIGGLALTASEIAEEHGFEGIHQIGQEIREQIEAERERIENRAHKLEMQIEIDDGPGESAVPSDPAQAPAQAPPVLEFEGFSR